MVNVQGQGVASAGLGFRREMLDELAQLSAQPPQFMEVAPENWIPLGGDAPPARASLVRLTSESAYCGPSCTVTARSDACALETIPSTTTSVARARAGGEARGSTRCLTIVHARLPRNTIE